MADLIVPCSGCNTSLQIDQSLGCRRFRCPHCLTVIELEPPVAAIPVASHGGVSAATLQEEQHRPRPRRSVHWIVPALAALSFLIFLIVTPLATYLLLRPKANPIAKRDRVVEDLGIADASTEGKDVESVHDIVPTSDGEMIESPLDQPISGETQIEGAAPVDNATAVEVELRRSEQSEPARTEPEPAHTEPALIKAAPDETKSITPDPVVPEPVTLEPAPPAPVAKEADLIRYRWNPGDEHVYSLKIESDRGNSRQEISGSCVYRVKKSPGQTEELQERSGSGFVVDADGLVATCAHLVSDARRIEVRIDGRTFSAQVVAQRPSRDLALIRVDAKNLIVANLGDSDQIELAERVRAFGFPLSDFLGTGMKVATGTVSGIVMNPTLGKQIQIDAAINEGNSGGPIVNESGQVIAVASSKMSNRVATSVGFAVPVNQLRSLMTENGVSSSDTKSLPAINGPTIVKQISPSVAFIKVWGRPEEVEYRLDFTSRASVQWNHRASSSYRSPLARPSSNLEDRGEITVSTTGDVSSYDGKEALPYVLGPLGLLCLETIDPGVDGTWSREGVTFVSQIERKSRDLFSQIRSRSLFGNAAPDEAVTELYPAVFSTTFRQMEDEAGRATVLKEYHFKTTKNKNRPYITVEGKGTILFDRKLGVPWSYDYRSTMITSPEGKTSIATPVKVSFQLKAPEVVKAERKRLAEFSRLRRIQAEKDRTIPRPDVVEELLATIRSTANSYQKYQSYKRLATLVVIDEKREMVLSIARSHLDNDDSMVSRNAAEAFCHWASETESDGLIKICESDSIGYSDAKEKAARKLLEYGDPDSYSSIVYAMKGVGARYKIKPLLIEAGAKIEPAILNSFESISDNSARRDLIEILEKVGTKKCLPLLESLVDDERLERPARQALDAVRSAK